ncbi:MAG: PA2169 family four-helix-bundle protein [Phycisphaerales bacterium]|nr:PA2169 family four-helix-bundle protein [Hyphomonadaceae bacterium]
MKRFLVAGVALLAACSAHPVNDNTAAIEARSSAPARSEADVAALQGLTRILIDASALYGAAAEQAQDETYARQLSGLSDARQSMTNLFQARVARLGGDPAESGQALGTAHRMFMDARMLGDDDTKVAVQEALRGENYLVDQMNEAKDNVALTDETRAFIDAQLPRVIADRDRLSAYAESLA